MQPSRKNKYRNNRGGNRSKSISKIGESIAALANYTVRSLTQSRTRVQPIESNPQISQEIKKKPMSVDHNSVNITFGNGKKRKPNKTAKRIKKNKQP